MPSVTSAQRHKLNRDPVSDPHVILLEFQEDGQAVIERAAINTEDIVWNGNTYVAAAIDVVAPMSGGDETSAQLRASNVDRVIGRALNAATGRVNVRIIVIDTALPDVALIDTKNNLVFTDTTIAADVVSATLGSRMSLLEPVPPRRTTRSTFPGVWLQ